MRRGPAPVVLLCASNFAGARIQQTGVGPSADCSWTKHDRNTKSQEAFHAKEAIVSGFVGDRFFY
jgi:hypothetical protein